MKKKQIIAFLLSAILTVSACLPTSSVSAFAKENTDVNFNELIEADTEMVAVDDSELSNEASTDTEISVENEEVGKDSEQGDDAKEEIIPEKESATEVEDNVSENVEQNEVVKEENGNNEDSEEEYSVDVKTIESKNEDSTVGEDDIIASGNDASDYFDNDKVTWVLKGPENDLTLIFIGPGKIKSFAGNTYKGWDRWSDQIKRIIIGEGVTTIGAYAFLGHSKLESISLPSTLVTIGESAFSGCENLENVQLQEGLERIGKYVFKGCTKLTSINVPESVKKIEKGAFDGPIDFHINSIKTWMDIELGYDSHYDSYNHPVHNLYINDQLLTELVIPQDITSIRSHVFMNCNSLERVTIPDSVTEIGESSFSNCDNLRTVIVSDSVQEIGTFAFAWCDRLEEVVLPNGLKCISSQLFYQSGLRHIAIPSSVETIDYSAFYECERLKEIIVPSSVKNIETSAFESCKSLESIILSEGLTQVNKYAFSYCSKLVRITIPSSVLSIGNSVFTACDRLNKVFFTGPVPSISDRAFSSLTATVYYPENDSTWNESVRKDYGGNSITWTPWNPEIGGNREQISFITQETLAEQGIDYSRSCALEQSMILYASYFNPDSGHSIEGNITVEISNPEVLSLESIERTTEVASGCILTDVTDECYRITLKANHYGYSTVTLKAGILSATSEELSIEPQMTAGTTTTLTTITSPVTVFCKVNLDAPDADYLNDYIDGITYWSHNPYLEIKEETVTRTVSEDETQGEISFVVVPKEVPEQSGTGQTAPSDGPIAVDTPSDNGTESMDDFDIGFTSKYGQTTGVNLKSGIKPLLSLQFLNADGEPDLVSTQYNCAVCWEPNLLMRGYNPSEIPIRVTVTYNPGTGPSTETATLRKITLSMEKELEMFKFEGSKSELTVDLNEVIPDGNSYTFDAKLVKRGMFWADPGLEPGESKSGKLNVSIEGDFPGYETLPTDSLTVMIYRENDENTDDPSAEEDEEIEQLSEAAYDEYKKIEDRISLAGDLESALTDGNPDAWSRRMNEALKSAIFTEAVTFFYLEDVVKEQSGLSDQVAKQIADKIKKKWWGLEEELTGLDSSSVQSTFGLLNMRIPGDFDLPMSFKLNHDGKEIICNFVCHISPAPELGGSKFGFTGSIDGEVVFVKEDRHVTLSQGIILDYDMTKFAEGAWKVASKELKKGFNMMGGAEMTEVLQSFASSRINQVVDVAAEYGLEKPVKGILNYVYQKKLKSKMDVFEILAYPSKLAVQNTQHSKSATSKEIVARCPVDIYVYDGGDNEVGRFVDDIAENIGENVDMWSVGTEKHIRLYDDTYRLEYIPTGNGVMQLTIYDYKGASDAVRTTDYVDVPLQIGVNYSQNIEENLLVDTATYSLHSDSVEITADTVNYNFGGENSGICGDNLTWMLDKEGTLFINGYGDMYDYSGTPVSDYRTLNFRRVVLSSNLTSIGNEAFKGCHSIEEIQFLGNMPIIGNNAFGGVTANAIVPYFWEDLPSEQFGGNINWQKEKIDLQDATVSGIKDMVYSGKAITQTISVENNNVTLVLDKDYTVSYKDNINAGLARVIIKGIGDYSGTLEKEFKITAKKITPTVTLSTAAYTYNGKVRKPLVTVKNGSTKLSSSNYTVTYASGRKNPGSYKVVVKMKGNYAGTKTVSFKINPKGTTLSYLSSASKKMTVKWKKQSLQTTGYQIQYATDSKFTKNKKTVTIKGVKTTAKTIAKLTGGKKYYVRIRTFKTVSKKNYYSTWSKMKSITVRK